MVHANIKWVRGLGVVVGTEKVALPIKEETPEAVALKTDPSAIVYYVGALASMVFGALMIGALL